MSDIDLAGVGVRLAGRAILCDVSIHMGSGAWVGIVGPNGAGKTTLLRVIAGLQPYDGSVVIDGVEARAITQRRRARIVSLVPQRPTFPDGMTVGDYVLLGRTPHIGYFDVETRTDRMAVTRALVRLGVADFAPRTLSSLSGGEQQRVVLARSLAQEASVLLLDEGTSALDVGAQQEVLDLVDDLRNSEGLTVVSAMHDLMLAAQYPDRLALLSGGRIVRSGQPREVLTSDVISVHYDARVRVTHDLDGIVIRPVRTQGAYR